MNVWPDWNYPTWIRRRHQKQRWTAEIERLNQLFSKELSNPHAYERGDLTEYIAECATPDSELGWLETEPLAGAAERLGVEIPEEWWYDTSDGLYGRKYRRYLQPKHRSRLRKLVVDARFANRKRWVDLIAPILGALTGVIGAIIGAIALLKHSK